MRNDLVRSPAKAVRRKDVAFDHILVETSGLADPTPGGHHLLHRQRRLTSAFDLDAVVTLVDAKHIGAHLDDPRLDRHENQAVDQIVAADRIVINKVDLVSRDVIRRLENEIRKLNQTADILHSSYAKIDLSHVLGVGGFAPSYVRERADLLDLDGGSSRASRARA